MHRATVIYMYIYIYILQRVSNTAKDEICNFSLRDAEVMATAALVHLEITWVDRRCAFNAQHLF